MSGPRVVIDAITEAVARETVDAGFSVHRALGPGLLESVYKHCLVHELVKRGLQVARQVAQPVVYDGLHLEAGYRLDVVVGQRVIVEIKAVEALAPIHEAQILTYLKLSGLHLGLLMNFNSTLLKEGLRRFVA